MTVQAIGVCVAPEKTATNPIPAKNDMGKGTIRDKALPSVAPTKNRGVTSPPLNPAPSVNPVNNIFKRKSYQAFGLEKESTIAGIPKPIYFVVPIKNMAAANMIPPTKGRSGGKDMFFENK